MNKVLHLMLLTGLSGLAAPAPAALAGPYGTACRAGEPAVVVRVQGLKTRTGVVRVQLYESNRATFLEKKAYLERIDVPASGAMDICVPVPRAGSYAISVRHDVNGNGKSDRADGGGFSGNPDVSLFDLATKRKPDLRKVSFAVTDRPVTVSVLLNYVQGLSFKPI